MQQTLTIQTDSRVAIQDITQTVQDRASGVSEGICHVFVPHTTAGIFVNEAESNLLEDITDQLESLVPTGDRYAHDRIDDNADAHLRSMLLGPSVSVPITDGTLGLGTWQRILFFEGDGPRSRSVTVTLIEG